MRKIINWLRFWHIHDWELIGIDANPNPYLFTSIFMYECKSCNYHKDVERKGRWGMNERRKAIEINELEKMMKNAS